MAPFHCFRVPLLLALLYLIGTVSARPFASVRLRKNAAPDTCTSATNAPGLGSLLCVDFASALSASAMLSPIVTIIDKSVTMAAAGSSTVIAAVKSNFMGAAVNPVKFFSSPEYLCITGVYFATYACANSIETICTRQKRSSALPKFVGTSTANIATCVAKDVVFARMFGSSTAALVPKRTLALFCARDSLTVLASFIVPPQLAHVMTNLGVDAGMAFNSAQVACPVAVQLTSTPIHLLGLDFYNRTPGSVNLSERCQASFRNYAPVASARMIRVLPAFGIGGIGNRLLRRKGRSVVEQMTSSSTNILTEYQK